MSDHNGMDIERLGEACRVSPRRHGDADDVRIPLDIECADGGGVSFERAGPRERIFFDPAAVRAGIVTCGGLCPGLNNVVRSLFMELHHGYGVREIIGFRDGYRGLDPARARAPIRLVPIS
jgi:6-phosphofructokinase 1